MTETAHIISLLLSKLNCYKKSTALYIVNQKKTWQFIFDYNFG